MVKYLFLILDANGQMLTREIIIGIVTQRDLLNYIMKVEHNGSSNVSTEIDAWSRDKEPSFKRYLYYVSL